MGLSEQRRGRSYEYRIRNWFRNKEQKPDLPSGWQAERNPLSGASKQIEDEIGLYDVRAWKGDIFLQIEAKKTGKKDKRIIKRAQLDKLKFDNDELYVFAFSRSSHYALISLDRYLMLMSGRSYGSTEVAELCYGSGQIRIARGEKQFTFRKEWLEDSSNSKTIFYWPETDTYYVSLPLTEFIKVRELYQEQQADKILSETYTPTEFIKRCNDIEQLLAYYEESKDSLLFKEKRILFSKCERLEAGIDNQSVGGRFMASQQWWLPADETYVCTCPSCEMVITAADLRGEQKDKGEKENGSRKEPPRGD